VVFGKKIDPKMQISSQDLLDKKLFVAKVYVVIIKLVSFQIV